MTGTNGNFFWNIQICWKEVKIFPIETAERFCKIAIIILGISCKALNMKEETEYVKYHEMGGQAEVLDWNTGHCDCSPEDYQLSSRKHTETTLTSVHGSTASQSTWFILAR